MQYGDYSISTVEDVARLRRRIAASGIPEKLTDRNLIIGTWNIRGFGRVYGSSEEPPAGAPKRNLRALALIAEIVRRYDVLAIQEVKRDTQGIRLLLDEFLGSDWGLILSDVTAGDAGNSERLALIFDRRRVRPTGLSGEIVLPKASPAGDPPAEQFDRTPYIVGFEARGQRFVLLTTHIKYGAAPAARGPELAQLALYTAKEIRDRAMSAEAEERNLIVLGDMNIDERGDNPLFMAFVSSGLMVPEQLLGVKSTYGQQAKYYDHIAWFPDENFTLAYATRAGSIDFSGAVFKELTTSQLSYRLSDHLPLWVEFRIDRSAEEMGRVLGLSEEQLARPDPLSDVPN